MTSTKTLPASIANLTKPKAYLSCSETAKLIRKALKEAFPEIKFTVRSSAYSGGASIRVGWFMGPLAAQVEAVAKRFSGASFDGTTDSTNLKAHAIDGQPTSFGAHYVFCDRGIDRTKVAQLAAVFAGVDRDCWLTIASNFGLGQEACRWFAYHMDAQEVATNMLRSLPQPAFDGRRSATADAVTLLSRE